MTGGEHRDVYAETYDDGTQVQTLTGAAMRFAPRVALDFRVARVAAAQHGAISVSQLGDCGLSGRAVRGRTAVGRLHRCHRGVYRLGAQRLSPLGAVAAALLACGPGAVASHLTAAWLHALRPDARAVIDVSARSVRRRENLVVHCVANLRPVDTTVVDGLPVTSIARTVLDCTPRLGRRGAETLCQEAILLPSVRPPCLREPPESRFRPSRGVQARRCAPRPHTLDREDGVTTGGRTPRRLSRRRRT